MQPPVEPIEIENFEARVVIRSSLSPTTDIKTLDWANVLSNHSAQVTPISGVNSDLEALTWNLMARVENATPGQNNAFNRNTVESEEEYKNRLSKMAAKLAEEMNKPRLGLVALQEAPNDKVYRAHFLQALKSKLQNPAHWNLDEPQAYSQIEGTSFGLLTLVNNQWLTPTYKPEGIEGKAQQQKRLLVTDVTFKKTHTKPIPTTTDFGMRFVNSHFAVAKPAGDPIATDLAKLKTSFQGQVLFAGHFDQTLDGLGFPMQVENDSTYSLEGDNVRGKKVEGFIFKENPETYDIKSSKLPSPIKTTLSTTENFTKKIKVGDLIAKFSKAGESEVELKKDFVIIKNLKKAGETVEIKKSTEDKLQFKTSHSSDSTIDILIESIKTCLPEKSTITINIKDDPSRADEIQSLKEKIWLKAVKSNLVVENFKPSAEFLRDNADVPDEYKSRGPFLSS